MIGYLRDETDYLRAVPTRASAASAATLVPVALYGAEVGSREIVHQVSELTFEQRQS